MRGIDNVVTRILRERAALPERRSLLVGVSGIDGCGKGFAARQLEAQLKQQSIAIASINIDGWLNLPGKRFNPIAPGQHFYENAIRFDELFTKLLLPLRDLGSVELTADVAEETAHEYRQKTYKFKSIDVVLAEGIFLFKREYRTFFDLGIWIDCSFPTALARALERAQEGLSPAATLSAYNNIYFPAQQIHLAQDHPRESADVIIDNDSSSFTS